MASASTLTADEVAGKFHGIALELMQVLSDMVKDLNDDGFTKTTTATIDVIIGVAGDMDNKKLMTAFLENSKLWPIIVKRELRALMKELPKLFEGIPVDLSPLIIPVTLYLEHQSGKLKGDYPHDEEDIDALWEYFDQLIKGACRYNQLTGNKRDLKAYDAK